MFDTSLVQKTTAAMWQKAKLDASSRRKDDASLKLDLYNDSHLDHVLRSISKQYKDPEKLLPVSINIVKKIVRALSVVYLRDAVRSVEGSKQDQDIYSEIEDAASLATKMKQANRYQKLLGTVLLRPLIRNGKPDLDILTGDILDVFTGQSPEDIQAVMISLYDDSGNVGETKYSLWTAERHYLLNYSGNEISSEENPYGVLPFIPVWNTPPTESLWLEGASDLVMVQQAIYQRLTDLLYTMKFQGFGVGYVRGKGVESDELLTVGPGSLMKLPEGGDVGFASPNAPIQDSLDAIDKLMKWAAITNGLSAGSISSEVREESGRAKMIDNASLDELRRDDVATFARVEDQLFQLWKIIWNHHNPGRQISESATLTIDFYDPPLAVSERTLQAEYWEKMMDMGLMSPIDVLLEQNPDLSRDDAKKRYDEIKDELREFRPDDSHKSGPVGSGGIAATLMQTFSRDREQQTRQPGVKGEAV